MTRQPPLGIAAIALTVLAAGWWIGTAVRVTFDAGPAGLASSRVLLWLALEIRRSSR